jgi:uncharacterized membrane protein
MMLPLLAFPLGIVAGLRVMLVAATVSWASYLGLLDLEGTWLEFLGRPATPWILTILAVGELLVDQLSVTPSRKIPIQFGARIMSGALAGAALGMDSGRWFLGTVLGVAGAILGTLGGYAFRTKLAARFGRDRPAAFIEDAVAIGGALLILIAMP